MPRIPLSQRFRDVMELYPAGPGGPAQASVPGKPGAYRMGGWIPYIAAPLLALAGGLALWKSLPEKMQMGEGKCYAVSDITLQGLSFPGWDSVDDFLAQTEVEGESLYQVMSAGKEPMRELKDTIWDALGFYESREAHVEFTVTDASAQPGGLQRESSVVVRYGDPVELLIYYVLLKERGWAVYRAGNLGTGWVMGRYSDSRATINEGVYYGGPDNFVPVSIFPGEESVGMGESISSLRSETDALKRAVHDFNDNAYDLVKVNIELYTALIDMLNAGREDYIGVDHRRAEHLDSTIAGIEQLRSELEGTLREMDASQPLTEQAGNDEDACQALQRITEKLEDMERVRRDGAVMP